MSQLSALGLSFVRVQYGFALVGQVGYRNAAAAVRILRTAGFHRSGFAGLWAR